MNTYRVGYKENAVGNSWYSCEKKLLGLVWTETQTFESLVEIVKYAKYLERRGHYVINVNLPNWH